MADVRDAGVVCALAAGVLSLAVAVRSHQSAGASIDGGHADTDYDAEQRRARRWALLPVTAALLALAAALLGALGG